MPKDRFMTEAGRGQSLSLVTWRQGVCLPAGLCALFYLWSSAREGWLACETFCGSQGHDTQDVVSVLLCVILNNSHIN